MEIEKLVEIKKNLATLPMLQRRIEDLRGRIRAVERDVDGLLERYKAESLDVEKLEKNSFSTLILKNFGRYEDRLTKESEEMLAAKLEYDKAAEKLNDLKKALKESEGRLAALNQDRNLFEAELEKRRKLLKSDPGSEVSKKYSELEAEQDRLAKQMAETQEAVVAAQKVMATAGYALEQLESAENWATFDVWTRGGIINHLAKYEHIDNAKQYFNQLNSQLERLQKELSDINMAGTYSLDGIDSTTRTIDFWFDNIFTDMNVRNRIREDKDTVADLRSRIGGLAGRLEDGMKAIGNKIRELEQMKTDLMING